MSSPAARALLSAVGFYRRAISPVLGPRCRFVPTCSEYAQEAVQVHGAARGSWLAVARIAKCAPWHPGGVDLVPGTTRSATDPGTAQHVHSSDTGAGPAAAVRPTRAPRPTGGRIPQQEAGVA
ncbi:membrane protein insertion efficiency factor YidD [Modestobacter sp. Leaf380]|uniref:membrane protein insertion efficiency factor YidD n=1 Tax=Modestobacter sp. Leaf380 TaxID=1736356 RepID=UPI0006F85EFA|nr:membrane protein insertion efficiency factor YidD [Modestobacter sp. Leaf380]KQS66850.1 membrane protein insertion efficiency factor YidD [Modestobacter sp. Leaf380]